MFRFRCKNKYGVEFLAVQKIQHRIRHFAGWRNRGIKRPPVRQEQKLYLPAKAVSIACFTSRKVASTESLRGITMSLTETAIVPSASGRTLKAASMLTLSAMPFCFTNSTILPRSSCPGQSCCLVQMVTQMESASSVFACMIGLFASKSWLRLL